MTDKIVVLSTCSDREEAQRIANGLVERKLAACVNIVPGVESVYHWKGAVERSPEFLLIIKSNRESFEKLSSVLAGLHSYEVAEALALPIVDGSENYLAWLDRELGDRRRLE
jgi:periplasmic divalent cation tolerance protein